VSSQLADSRSLKRAAFDLTLTSFIVLFQELALIRWMGGQVRVLAYFPNIVLISAFLGLGIGTMRAGKPLRLWLWPGSLMVLVIAAVVMHGIAFTSRSASEFLWLLYSDISHPPIVHDVRPPMLIAFLLTAIAFVVPGQIVGERLQDFRRAGNPLGGYVADLAGSLIGVIAFTLASFYRTFPATWFAIILLGGVLLFAGIDRRALIAQVICAVGILTLIVATEHTAAYSPYYALRTLTTGVGKGIPILANGSWHQYAAPLRRADVFASDFDRDLRVSYSFPYHLLRQKPRRVLVLGAGSGNDVVIALENGAEQIDAVEIDPVIVEMGRSVHPDRPYLSPRVHVINTDARAFLRNTNNRYDLIIFGTLDSMTRVSALANVRLDNFVYTADCMRVARERLTSDGGMALYFMVHNSSIHDKLFTILTRAFGQPPLMVIGFKNLFSEIFLAGPAWDHLRTPEQKAGEAAAIRAMASVDVPTDDWPYLYLENRKISGFYWSVALMFLIVAGFLIALLAPEMRHKASQHFDSEMFLFGVAFLLLETKLVTQMSLLWGATWITNAVVFASILLMILIGTIATQYRSMPFPVAATGLVLTLLATYLVPTEWLLARSPVSRLALSIVFAGVPVLFASVCFALLFKKSANPNLSFGWNLAGAVVGGLIELVAMAVGLNALTLIALIGYLAAFLFYRRRLRGEHFGSQTGTPA
jgi:spermidine synthase